MPRPLAPPDPMSSRPLCLAVSRSARIAGRCASRPVNVPITEVNRKSGYRFETRQLYDNDKENLVILAFSGGGTRAAAFSYGVLEELRRTEIIGPKGNRGAAARRGRHHHRRLRRQLHRTCVWAVRRPAVRHLRERLPQARRAGRPDLSRFLSPRNWGALWSEGWGRSEMAAQMYDEIPVPRRDVSRSRPPRRSADHGVRHRHLDRLAPCVHAKRVRPHVLRSRLGAAVARGRGVLRGAARAVAGHAQQLRRHLQLSVAAVGAADDGPDESVASRGPRVAALEGDGGVPGWQEPAVSSISSMAGWRTTSACAACWRRSRNWRRSRATGRATRLDDVRRLVVFVVNSLSSPKTNWDTSERPPNDFVILLKATGVPIDRYSYEAVELLKDITRAGSCCASSVTQVRSPGARTPR